MAPLETLLAPAPQFAEAEVLRVLQQEFGLRGKLRPLLSERDQNFHLSTANGWQYVFKIANASEPQQATDCQVAALMHIEQQNCPIATPRVQRTLAGAAAAWIGGDPECGEACRCRVVSFLPGELMSSVELSIDVATSLGSSAAQLDLALRDFAHAGESQVLLWDLQRTAALRDILQHVTDADLRNVVQSCLDAFEQRVQPVLTSLRHQVIHSDLNPDNVLLTPANTVSGVIDFGDMLRAPLVQEVAITASYLRPGPGRDVLSWMVPFVAGYHSVLPLRSDETALLFDLVRARLAATVTILRWRAAELGAGDAYSSRNLVGEDGAAEFLAGLTRLGRDRFLDVIRNCIKNK